MAGEIMKKELLIYFNKHAGNLSLTDAKSYGFDAKYLDLLVEKNKLIKEAPGFYVLPDAMVDYLYMVQSIYKRGVFSHETALDMYQLSTNLPSHFHMTFPKGYHSRKERLDEYMIQPHYSSKPYFELGLTTTTSFHGNKIMIYDQERTLCDMWNSRYPANIEVKEDALKDYMNSRSRDTQKLRTYMEKLPVSKDMHYFMKALY